MGQSLYAFLTPEMEATRLRTSFPCLPEFIMRIRSGPESYV